MEYEASENEEKNAATKTTAATTAPSNNTNERTEERTKIESTEKHFVYVELGCGVNALACTKPPTFSRLFGAIAVIDSLYITVSRMFG